MRQYFLLGGFKMKPAKNTVPELIEKEVEKKEEINLFDRHTFSWFIDNESNELRIGKSLTDFLDKKTENFSIKRVLLCDDNYWKLVETTDGKFVLLSRTRFMK
jgi:hypothetical protein